MKNINTNELINLFHALDPWKNIDSYTDETWANYIKVAKIIQSIPIDTTTIAIQKFMKEANLLDESYEGYEHGSKVFILLRVVFNLPETIPAENSFAFIGWNNWPDPDAQNNINPGWPVTWKSGNPKLQGSYEGSLGQSYQAVLEFQFLLDNYPFRNL